MEMVQLNDLLPQEQWEIDWTILGENHEELPNDKEYVIFEHYCSTPNCDCQTLVAEIRELGSDGEPLREPPAAVISYDWSSSETSCRPVLQESSPKTKLALDLLEAYKIFVHHKEYLMRIKNQYRRVKELASSSQQRRATQAQAVNPNRNISRNDPCPCGSQKKFKKCCSK